MKPPPFQYRAPSTVDGVSELLATHTDDARVIAGGQSLIPLMNLRMVQPEVLIDLSRIDALREIELKDGELIFGTMVRQSVAQNAELTRTHCPLISKAIARAGPIAVRNRGTVGGTLAHADRTAELPGVAVALDARFVLTSAEGERIVPAIEFFQGDMTTAIEANEFLSSVHFPVAPANAWAFFDEVGARREGVALVGLAVQIVPGDGASIRSARLAVTGVDAEPVRLSEVETALAGREVSDALIDEVTGMASAGVEPMDDIFTSAVYRRKVVGALVRRALSKFRTDRS